MGDPKQDFLDRLLASLPDEQDYPARLKSIVSLLTGDPEAWAALPMKECEVCNKSYRGTYCPWCDEEENIPVPA